jgi:hypothetical protein
LKTALAERVLDAEMDHHLGRRAGQPAQWLWQEDGHHRYRPDRAVGGTVKQPLWRLLTANQRITK